MIDCKQITFMQECKLCSKDDATPIRKDYNYFKNVNVKQERRFITSCDGCHAICTNCGFRITYNKDKINEVVENEKIEKAIQI